LAAEAATEATKATSWPAERLVGRASALKLGMWVFLLSDALSFAGLLISYGVLRAGAERWWPAGEPAFGINFTAGLTFLLICSSVTMVMAVAAAKEDRRGQTLLFLGLTILGGLGFLTGQYNEYFGLAGHHGLVAEGLHFGQSHRATTFFLITSFHGLHVTAGVIYLSIVWLLTAAGRFRHGRFDAIEVAGLFWHFVDLVWILVFTFVYLIPTAPTP
jgi:cytochrome c oxidase subunit 3